MQKDYLINRLFLLSLFLILEFILLYTVERYYDNEQKKVLEQNLIDTKNQFETINKTLDNLANASFKGFIDREEVKKAFANRDRDKLFDLLEINYTYLKSFGFKQVHFHLPNRHSFLRMHKPEKSGDDLTSFRYSVDYTNEYHKSIKGFETGRVLPGIRNVYPIFYKDKYIGSVEMSFSIEKFIKEIEKVYNVYTHFLIEKDMFDKTVFAEDKKFYKQSIENKKYIELKREGVNSFFKEITFDKELLGFIDKELSIKKQFNFDIQINKDSKIEDEHKHIIVTFLPVVNIKGDNVMFFVFYKESKNLKIIESHRESKKIIFSIMLFGTFVLLYLLMRNNEITLKSKEFIEKEKTKYKDLMSLATDGIHILDKNGNIYEVNTTFQDMLGYTTDEIKTLNVKDFDVYLPQDSLIDKIEELIKSAQAFNTKHQKKDGSIIEVQINAKGLEINGETYLYASSRDITEERNAYRKLQKFIDLQDNIVVVTDLNKLSFANKRFIEFTGFNDIEQFNDRVESICDLFVENDRFFHQGKLLEKENWIDYLERIPHSKRIVGMLKYDYNLHAFAVTVNRFEDDYFILTFTNITQTMLNHIKLEDKTIHDKMTNAFNREYFEQNSKSILKEFTKDNSSLGIAFLDIDHFKSVNDTFGHDIGDEVLIHFVKTIQKFSRENDILIRWGGEEFIFLLKINSNESLTKALEHIRKVIELENFNIVGHITCSIGGSLYIEGESLSTTIKRADAAVYKAKNNGRNRVEID